MPIEEQLESAKAEVEKNIKTALLSRGMTQKELADLIGESTVKVNLAVKGNVNPKSVAIRKKIYRVLGMKG